MTALFVSYRYYDSAGQGYGCTCLRETDVPRTPSDVDRVVAAVIVPGAVGSTKVIPLFWSALPDEDTTS